MLSGYYECLKSISPKLKDKESILGNTKVLPIYIDLSTCTDLFDAENDLNLIEVHFIRQIIESLKRQLELMFDESFLLVFKKENPALDDLDFIEKVLVEGISLYNHRTVNVASVEKEKNTDEVLTKLFLNDVSVSGGITESFEKERLTTSR